MKRTTRKFKSRKTRKRALHIRQIISVGRLKSTKATKQERRNALSMLSAAIRRTVSRNR